MMKVSAFCVTREKQLLEGDREIANFLPAVVRAYWTTGTDGHDPPDIVIIRVQRDGWQDSPEKEIPYEALSRFDFERQFPGCVCADAQGRATKKLVVRFIRERIDQLPRDLRGVFLPTTGWHENRFVAGGQLIGAGMYPSPMIAPSAAALSLSALPDFSDGEAAEGLLLMLQHIADVGLPTFAYTLYSSLLSVFRAEGLPTTCVLNLHGAQGFGKTTLAKRLCALYEVDGQAADVFDAGSSFSAVRDALAEARDRVVVLDDVCKSSDASNQRKRLGEAAKLLRVATNEIPIVRKQGRKNACVKCQAGLVITGEIDFGTASDLTRCVHVKLNKPLTDGRAEDRKLAATALAGYLRWFAANAERERECLRIKYAAFRVCERSHREERLQISLWELSWIWASFLRFARTAGAVSEEASKQIESRMDFALQQTFEYTQVQVAALEKQTLQNIAAVIERGVTTGAFPYFVHRGCICVRSEKLQEYMQLVTGRTDLTVKDVTTILRREQLLRMDASGDSTCKIKGKRMLCIPQQKLAM